MTDAGNRRRLQDIRTIGVSPKANEHGLARDPLAQV
jgi:hypothetical protein